MLTTCELGAACAATMAAVIAPEANTVRDKREMESLRMRDFPLLPEVDIAQGTAKGLQKGGFYKFLT
jgi:hypothetical protein